MEESNHPGNFCSRPASIDLPDQWKIMRCSKTGTPPCLILSEDTVGAYVHYYSGRTRLCLKRDCEPCHKGQAPRWRGYLAVIVHRTRATRLLELTPSVVPEIDRWCKQRGSLRGLIITLSRKGKVANGELECVLLEKPDTVGDLPACPDVSQHLVRIWRSTHAPRPSDIAVDGRTAAQQSGLIPPASRNGRAKLAT